MSLTDSLATILELDIPADFDCFGKKLGAEWINDALEETGKRHVKIKMSSYKRNPGRPIAKGTK